MCEGGRLRGRAAGYVGCGRGICVKVADSGAELQAMVDVVEAYVPRWKVKFNRKQNKVMEWVRGEQD